MLAVSRQEFDSRDNLGFLAPGALLDDDKAGDAEAAGRPVKSRITPPLHAVPRPN